VPTLNVTSGDKTVELLRQSSVPGELLPWRDVLHEGPVPAGLSLEELSRVRARFISDSLWGESFEQVLSEFAERDNVLKAFKRFDEIVLWFEHDLYDQLHLLQLLQWFALRRQVGPPLTVICIGEYPGIERFLGLTQLSPDQLDSLYEQRTPVTETVLTLGESAWKAFTNSRPDAIQELLREELSALPFLRGALFRHLEQFPSTRNGLSRTETQILEVLQAGPAELRRVFRASQIELEERPFMGDVPFMLQVRALGAGREPLLAFEDGQRPSRSDGPPFSDETWRRRLAATEAGLRVLTGQVDRGRYQNLDRWLGGVHLLGEKPAWRWAHRKREIIEQTQ
jgi:hypothetical protein